VLHYPDTGWSLFYAKDLAIDAEGGYKATG
jgi:hypothetical protein